MGDAERTLRNEANLMRERAHTKTYQTEESHVDDNLGRQHIPLENIQRGYTENYAAVGRHVCSQGAVPVAARRRRTVDSQNQSPRSVARPAFTFCFPRPQL